LLVLVQLLAACSGPPGSVAPAIGELPFAVLSARAEPVAEGVTHRVIRSSEGPWNINVLDVELDSCTTAEALASSDSATIRMKTTEMLAALARRETVLGGVNADFFNLRDGTPTNLLVINGAMRTPPVRHPVLAIDSAGAAHIEFFALEDGTLRPFHPLQAVGGRPVLVRDSAIAAEADTFGSAGFRGPNPRTAAGITRDGKRLVLAVVDGRTEQDAGMTLRETAELMLALGAYGAINLDGGGSTTMVVTHPDSVGVLRIVNRPSDRQGERAVGDALAVVQRCR
jgi:hypothetical protein